MVVKELIEHLQKLDPDKRVIVYGYEGGFHDIEGLQLLPIKLNENNSWYYGPHEQIDARCCDETAYLINRVPNPQ